MVEVKGSGQKYSVREEKLKMDEVGKKRKQRESKEWDVKWRKCRKRALWRNKETGKALGNENKERGNRLGNKTREKEVSWGNGERMGAWIGNMSNEKHEDLWTKRGGKYQKVRRTGKKSWRTEARNKLKEVGEAWEGRGERKEESIAGWGSKRSKTGRGSRCVEKC